MKTKKIIIMKKIILLIISIYISIYAFPQKNLALDMDKLFEGLADNIGEEGAKMVFDTYNKYKERKQKLNNPLERSKLSTNDIEWMELYIRFYDTLAYRDIVSHPSPFSQNSKWLNIYKEMYPYLEIKDVEIPENYRYPTLLKNFSTGMMARITGPNQIVFLRLGKYYFWEATIEFSELSYTSTVCEPFFSTYFEDSSSVLFHRYQVSKVTVFYNAYMQPEMEIKISIEEESPLYEGRFVSHMRSKFRRFLNRINKTDRYDLYDPINDHCFCEGDKYCPMPHLINKYLRDSYLDSENDLFKYRSIPFHSIVTSLNYRYYFRLNGIDWWTMRSDDYPAISYIMFLPTGWHIYYDTCGNMTEKIFFVSLFKPFSKKITGTMISELYTTYRTVDSGVVKEQQVYFKFSDMLDSVDVISEETGVLKRVSCEEHLNSLPPYDYMYSCHIWGNCNKEKISKLFYQKYKTYYRIYHSQIENGNLFPDWTGTYIDDKKRTLTIETTDDFNIIKFKIVQGMDNCNESIEGTAEFTNYFIANYFDKKSKCHLNFSNVNGNIEITEHLCKYSNSCSSLDGLFIKKK
jgi:hypothetical protein